MAPAKKKGKKLPLPSNTEPSTSGSVDPPAPVQRKRGRPRKIVKEEAESLAPPLPEGDLGIAAGIKRVKLKKEQLRPEDIEAKPQPPLKNSRRRKSEPHRAPGVLIEGL